MARNTAGAASAPALQGRVVLTQSDMCTHVLQPCEDTEYIVQVSYLSKQRRPDFVHTGFYILCYLLVEHTYVYICYSSIVIAGSAIHLLVIAL